MKKHRRLILIIVAAVVLVAVLVAVALVLGSRRTTSYGTATSESAYAPAVRQMVDAQQSLADSVQSVLESQPDHFSDVQQSFDHQSAQASSPLSQFFGSPNCPIGQVRYTDVLNLTVNSSSGAGLEVGDLLKEAVASGGASGGSLQGTTVRFPNDHFRIEVTRVSAGDKYTFRFTVPNLQSKSDSAAYACYPAAKVPLSSVQQLG